MAQQPSSLNDIISAVGQATQRNVQAGAEIERTAQQAKGAYGSLNDILDKAASDASAVKLAESTAENNARLKALEAATNMGATFEAKQKLATDMQAHFDQAKELNDVIAQKRSVSLLDNPIDWFFNQLTLDGDIERYNAVAEQYNTAEARLLSLNSMATSEMQTALTLKEAKTSATLEAESRLAGVQYGAQAQTAKIEAAKFDRDTITELQRLDENNVNNMLKVQDAVSQQQSMEFRKKEFAQRQQDLDLQRKRLDLDTQIKELTLEEKQERDRAKNAAAAAVNAGRKILNLPPIESADEVARMLQTQGQIGNQFRAWYNSGATYLYSGKRFVGATAADAVELIATSGASGTSTNGPLYQLVHNKYNQFASTMGTKDTAAISVEAAKAVNMELANKAANITYGDKTNLFHAPAAATVISEVPALAKANPFVAKVLLPTVQLKGDEDPSTLLRQGMQAIRDGKMTMEELATGVAAYYDKAVKLNAALRDFEALGFHPPSGYNAEFNLSGAWLGSTTVDLTNKTQVMSLINRQRAMDTRGRSGDTLFMGVR